MPNQYTEDPYTDEDCINSLRRAYEKLGKSPSGPEYEELELKPGISTIKRICGGWNKAKEKAELESWSGNPGYLSVNDSYFSEIDTTEKSYWLGFLFADGSVSDEYNTVSVQLQKDDESHLRDFADAIESEHKIRDIHTETSHKCGIDVISEEMVSDLKGHGCVPNKTHKDTLPNLEGYMRLHFIRGLFDGDGSFGVYEYSGSRHLRWVFTGSSIRRLEKVIGWMEEEDVVKGKPVRDYDYCTPFVQYSAEDEVMKMWSALFPDKGNTEPALERKKSNIAEFIGDY